ncbi:MAG: hypothetical protein KDI30_03320, partial [Pseudomonadales bacterium]|nr:hypothetical protein [Pseudomonadales bacterium]
MKCFRFCFIALLTLLAFLLLLCGLVFVFKVPIVKQLSEHYAPPEYFILTELYGIDINAGQASIALLEFESGHNSAIQRISDLTLSYSLPEKQLYSLHIEAIESVLPVYDSGTASSNAPLVLASLLQQLSSLAIPVIKIDRLHIKNFPPLSVTLSQDAGISYLQVSDENARLAVALEPSSDRLVLQAALERFSTNVVNAAIALEKKTDKTYATTANFAVDVGRLLDTFGFYQKWFPALALVLPEGVESLEGKLQAGLSAELPAEISSGWQPAGFNARLEEGSALQIHYNNEVYAPEGSVTSVLVKSVVQAYFEKADSDWLPSFESGRIEVDTQEYFHQSHLEASLSDVVCDWQVAMNCVADWHISASALAFDAGDYLLQKPEIQSEGQLFFEKDGLRLSLFPGEVFTAETVNTLDQVFIRPSLNVKEKAGVVMGNSGEHISAAFPQLVLQLPGITYEQYDVATVLTLNGVAVELLDQLVVRAHVVSDSLNIRNPDQWMPVLAFKSDVEMKGPALTAEASLSTAKQFPLLTITASHDRDNSSGDAQLVWTHLGFSAIKPLSSVFKPWPYPFDLVSGEFNGYANVHWHNENDVIASTAEIRHGFHGLDGFYEDIGFWGIHGDMKLKLDSHNDLVTEDVSKLMISKLDVGLPIENLVLDYAFNTARNEYRLNSMNAVMLGGVVSTADVVYRQGSEEN